MKITIELPIVGGAKMPVSGGLVLPDTLSVDFKSEYALPELIIHARNGEKTDKEKTRNAVYTVPAELMIPGTLEMDVALISRGEIVKRWAVEPLVIKDIDGDFTAFAAIEEMQEQIRELFRRTEIIQ